MTVNNLEFVDVCWYGTVGIILTQDNITLQYKTYIKDIHKRNGPSMGSTLLTQIENDIIEIMSYGNKFTQSAAKELFPGINFDSGKYFKETNPEYTI